MLQHPHEQRETKNSVALLRLSLAHCEVCVGERFAPEVLQGPAAPPGRHTCLLYPNVPAAPAPPGLASHAAGTPLRLVVTSTRRGARACGCCSSTRPWSRCRGWRRRRRPRPATAPFAPRGGPITCRRWKPRCRRWRCWRGRRSRVRRCLMLSAGSSTESRRGSGPQLTVGSAHPQPARSRCKGTDSRAETCQCGPRLFPLRDLNRRRRTQQLVQQL